MGCAAYIIALGGRDRISGALHEHMWGLVFPFIGFLAIYFIFLSVRLRPKALPFTMTVLFIVAAILTLAVMFWPYMIPYEITVANAAAPESLAPGRSYCRRSRLTPRQCTDCSGANYAADMRAHPQSMWQAAHKP